MIMIYITNKDMDEAKKIVNHLLKKKLIACANMFPIESICPWEGKVENSKEVVAIVKTVEKNWEKIKKEVKKIHSYKIPCIIKIKAEANKEYEKWVESETK